MAAALRFLGLQFLVELLALAVLLREEGDCLTTSALSHISECVEGYALK